MLLPVASRLLVLMLAASFRDAGDIGRCCTRAELELVVPGCAALLIGKVTDLAILVILAVSAS